MTSITRSVLEVVEHEINVPAVIKPRRRFRKLSVLMPVYNEKWTLAEIIQRVLAAPVELDIELIVVDDGSTDGSFELLCSTAADDPRIQVIRHQTNRGKGAAIRSALEQVSGDIVLIQDADLEYDPQDYPSLLGPIIDGKADAVYGSRFRGDVRRVLFFWHSLGNSLLTLLSNCLNDLNLTDMETGYKAVRTAVIKRLRLTSSSFTFEPEITCRLAQWGARIYEVPIRYAGRTYAEGKKVRARDAIKAIGQLVKCRFLDTQFTDHAGFNILSSVSRANRYNEWTLKQVAPFLGRRVLEAGSGIGNLSRLLLNRERLVLVDNDEIYITRLAEQFGAQANTRIDQADLTLPAVFESWQKEQLDTILCSNVLEHLKPDIQVLRSFHNTLVPGGHCIIVVPAGQWLYTPLDRQLGHFRRYSDQTLRKKMQAAGFEVAFSKRFNRLGSISWALAGHVFRRQHLSARQMIWFDRMLPIVKLAENFLPVPGMSLIVVGRKPKAAARRMAA